MNKLPSNFELDRYGLHVRLVNESDAEFIVKLRTDDKLGRFINPTSNDIEPQIVWTREYKKREKQGVDYYFMFEVPVGNPVGVCRIYDIKEDEFTTGSWVFSKDAPIGSAILADIISREIAYGLFPDSICYFDVKKENISVNRYLSSYKSEIIREDEYTNYYKCLKDNFNKYKNLHLRMFAPKK